MLDQGAGFGVADAQAVAQQVALGLEVGYAIEQRAHDGIRLGHQGADRRILAALAPQVVVDHADLRVVAPGVLGEPLRGLLEGFRLVEGRHYAALPRRAISAAPVRPVV